jgi:hypothetical protein
VDVKGVPPGTHDLELRFSEARWIEVRVRDEQGEAREDFELFARSPDGSDWLGGTRKELHPGGNGRLRVPGAPFIVRVDARGFALAQRGPFAPEDAPAELEIELVPEPGVRGRVLAGGEPLAGARVALHMAPEGSHIDHQGYQSLVDPRAEDETRTDEAGCFTLKLRQHQHYVVRAEAPGWAASDWGPFELAPESGRDGLELVLGRGGALEGRVLVASGRDTAGVIVALNRGDAFPRTTRSDAEGRFGFEGLTAGPWHLARGKAEFNPKGGGTAFSAAAAPTVIPFNCTIRDGETTYEDLDLTEFEPCALAGILRVNGAPVRDWSVTGWPGGVQAIVGELPSTATAADGSFTLSIEDPGRLRLSFSPPAEVGGGSRFDVLTDVRPGANEWRGDLAMGRLTGLCLSTRPGEELLLFYNSAEGVEPSCWVPIQPDESGHYILPFVPAGKGSIRRLDRSDGEGTWTTLVETEVDARRESIVDIP